jgi:uncharacterized membrane protein
LRVKPENELAVINILSILLIIIISFVSSNVLRIILGLPFILFIPGYTLTVALFPKRAELNGIARVALSFGLSIAVSVLMGLILHYTPWGIGLYPIVVSLALFIFVTSIIAWYRRRRLPTEEGFPIRLNTDFLRWRATSRLNKVLTLILSAFILGVIGTLAYVIVTPKAGEKFTEFYVLGLDGKAENYPKELIVGEEGNVILGIVNHEQENDMVYRVEITINSEVNDTIGPLALANEAKWQSEVGFTPHKVGDNQKAEFVLYKQGEDKPYKLLYLWVDVKGTS